MVVEVPRGEAPGGSLSLAVVVRDYRLARLPVQSPTKYQIVLNLKTARGHRPN